jgi:uridine kinase
MARWAPAKRDTLREVAGEFLQHYGRGRVIVAVTGGPASGAVPFAHDLAAVLRDDHRTAIVADIADFGRPHGEPVTGEGALHGYGTGLDVLALRRTLIDPFRLGGSTGFQTAVIDPSRNAAVDSEWVTAGPDAVLLVAGPFLLRPELRGIWNFSIWLDLPLVQPYADAGMPTPPLTDADEEWDVAQRDDPRGAASALVDGRDPEHPRRIFADSC